MFILFFLFSYSFSLGIYFTGSYEYASKYAKNSYLGKVFVISCVIIGNAYPASEWPKLETQFQIAESQSAQKLNSDSLPQRSSSSSMNSLHSTHSTQSLHSQSNSTNQSHQRYAETLYGKACMKGYQSHYALGFFLFFLAFFFFPLLFFQIIITKKKKKKFKKKNFFKLKKKKKKKKKKS